MFVNYWDTDTPTLLLHVTVTVTRIPCILLVGHRYTSLLDTVISYIDIIVTWMLDTLLSRVHTSLLHMLTTRVYMHVLFLSYCHMTHRAYYTDYCFMLPYPCYMIVSGYWYGYSLTGLESCWYAIYGIPHLLFPFPVILSRFPLYCSMLSTELRSCYHVTHIMYCICSCYIVCVTYQIIKLTWVWGRLDGWLDLIGWCTGSILFSHCRGR